MHMRCTGNPLTNVLDFLVPTRRKPGEEIDSPTTQEGWVTTKEFPTILKISQLYEDFDEESVRHRRKPPVTAEPLRYCDYRAVYSLLPLCALSGTRKGAEAP